MKKLQKLVRALWNILMKPSLLNNVLNDENLHRNEVIKKYNLPLGLKTVEIHQLIPELRETIEPYSSLDNGSTPLDLALLKGLARNQPDCSYFEIGTWRGESVANVASVAKHCTTLNLPDEDMLKMGMDKNYVNAHRFFSKELKNVTHIQANSQTFDYSSLNKKFDLIFIDGDHHYESVKNDTSNAFELLKNDESIIVWHDYGNSPNDIRWEVLQGILDGTPPEKRKYLYRVSHTLCAIFTKKPIPSYFPTLFSDPSGFFSLTVKSRNL